MGEDERGPGRAAGQPIGEENGGEQSLGSWDYIEIVCIIKICPIQLCTTYYYNNYAYFFRRSGGRLAEREPKVKLGALNVVRRSACMFFPIIIYTL